MKTNTRYVLPGIVIGFKEPYCLKKTLGLKQQIYFLFLGGPREYARDEATGDWLLVNPELFIPDSVPEQPNQLSVQQFISSFKNA
jgi:hypothetical protein